MTPLSKALTTTLHGRTVTPGQELTIDGQRGRVRFCALVTHAETGEQWLDAVDARGSLRSFRLYRVKTVHRTVRMR